jgi:hypothetical protein
MSPAGRGVASRDSVASGDSVTLKAELSGSATASSVEWTQVLGDGVPVVELVRVDDLRVTFVAPPVTEVIALAFKLRFCGRRQGPYVPPTTECRGALVDVTVSPDRFSPG